jgi:ZIP family zinc transporter
MTTVAFGLGAMIMFLLDSLTPHMQFSFLERGRIKRELFTTGMLITIGLALHDIPEGVAIGAGFLHFPTLGIIVALAVALHNIPEGMAIAASLYSAGLKRKDALKFSLLPGLAEPLGTIMGLIFLSLFKGLIYPSLAFAAGVMVFITLDELIPTAHEYGHEHAISFGLILGFVTMFLISGIMELVI